MVRSLLRGATESLILLHSVVGEEPGTWQLSWAWGDTLSAWKSR